MMHKIRRKTYNNVYIELVPQLQGSTTLQVSSSLRVSEHNTEYRMQVHSKHPTEWMYTHQVDSPDPKCNPIPNNFLPKPVFLTQFLSVL